MAVRVPSPDEIGDIARPDFFDEIRRCHVGEKPLPDVVVIRPILAQDQRPRAEQRACRSAHLHGGVLDRVDALLFVLPATYYLVRALNIA